MTIMIKKFLRNTAIFKISLFVVSVIMFGLYFLPAAFAQTGITLQPSLIDERVEPGDVYSGTLQVTNETNTIQTYYFSAKDVEKRSESGRPIFASFGEDTGFGLASWVTLPKDPITVGALQTAEVDFSIQVPGDASPGTHIGGIFVGPKAEHLNEVGTGIGFQVVSMVSLQIAGDIVDKARIRDFITDSMLYSKPEVIFTTRVENLGNVAVKPRGPLDITNMWGKKIVSDLVVNDSGSLVLPGEIRKYELTWKGKEFYFGRYEAVMSLSYGYDAKNTITRTVSFWILPLNIILPVLGMILVIILGIYLMVKLYIKRSFQAIEKTTGKAPVLKKQAPMSRLSVIVIVLTAFTIIFLMGLFVFFA